jgi:hypothetical protein
VVAGCDHASSAMGETSAFLKFYGLPVDRAVRVKAQRHAIPPTKTTADSAIATRPRKTSNMTAWELGESSDAERLAMGLTMITPTATEMIPRIAPTTAMREVKGNRLGLPELLIPPR